MDIPPTGSIRSVFGIAILGVNIRKTNLRRQSPPPLFSAAGTDGHPLGQAHEVLRDLGAAGSDHLAQAGISSLFFATPVQSGSRKSCSALPRASPGLFPCQVHVNGETCPCLGRSAPALLAGQFPCLSAPSQWSALRKPSRPE